MHYPDMPPPTEPGAAPWQQDDKRRAMTQLHYTDDSAPGITRRLLRSKWAYFASDGTRITDHDEIDRLNRIGLPPAYRNAWFCPRADGHIQAVGWDEKGRKQYRYHADFRAAQDARKYDRCLEFGRRLSLLRPRVEADLARRDLCRERAIAAVVRLLDRGHLRVGNEGYARANRSFGATTLRKRHAAIGRTRLQLEFTAKSGKRRRLTITDASLQRFVRKCQDLPGQHLFGWLDDSGTCRPVTSTDVNDYIREAMGDDFTAKNFRTWGASVIAFTTLADARAPVTLAALLDPVAAALGNTPSIARKSYVHPDLIAAAKNGHPDFGPALRLPRASRWLSRHERGLIAFLEQPGAATALAA